MAVNREIDPEKWEQMLTTKTIQFELPEPGVKIAVKVVDQTGIEHMTVIDKPRDELRRETDRSGGRRRSAAGPGWLPRRP